MKRKKLWDSNWRGLVELKEIVVAVIYIFFKMEALMMYLYAVGNSLLRKTEIQICIIKMMYYGYCIMFIKHCC